MGMVWGAGLLVVVRMLFGDSDRIQSSDDSEHSRGCTRGMGRQSRTQAIMLTKDIQIGPDSSGHALQIALTDFGRMPLLQTSQPHLTPSCKSRRSRHCGDCQKNYNPSTPSFLMSIRWGSVTVRISPARLMVTDTPGFSSSACSMR